MKKEIVAPIVVLTGICIFIAAILGLTNSITFPIIEAAAAERAEAARLETIPQADGFEQLQVEGLPESITEVYKSTNDVGYVFMIKTKGYGGDMELICGIDPDGKIISCKTLSHSETAGVGAKTAEEPFRSQFTGVGEDLSGVSAISGATISSKAYMGAIEDAFTAYHLVKEANS